MLRQIQRALEPEMSLKNTIYNWNQIVVGLAAPPRKRRLQIDGFVGFWN